MQERRNKTRSPIELAASYGIQEDYTKDSQRATIINISSGGFCFSSTYKHKIGDEILLAIELDKGDEVQLPVRIVWSKPVGDESRFLNGVQIIEAEGPEFEEFLNFYCKTVKDD